MPDPSYVKPRLNNVSRFAEMEKGAGLPPSAATQGQPIPAAKSSILQGIAEALGIMRPAALSSAQQAPANQTPPPRVPNIQPFDAGYQDTMKRARAITDGIR